jgi:hypothetical protein
MLFGIQGSRGEKERLFAVDSVATLSTDSQKSSSPRPPAAAPPPASLHARPPPERDSPPQLRHCTGQFSVSPVLALGDGVARRLLGTGCR